MAQKKVITDEKGLGKALKEEADYIYIEGDLVKKVIRIKATGKVAWVVAIGSISVVVLVIVLTTISGGVAAPSGLLPGILGGGAAVSILGTGTTVSAISIAIASGGVAALNKLRSYKIIERNASNLVLKRI